MLNFYEFIITPSFILCRTIWVILIDRVVCCIAVKVDTTIVADRVPRQEPPGLRVVVAVRTQYQPRLVVGLTPPLRPEPPRVTRRGRAGARPEGVVEVGGQDAAARVEALGDIAALVEGVEDAGIGGRRVAGDEAIGPEGVEGLNAPIGVEFGHGVGAVVEVIGTRPGVGLLPGPQTVPGRPHIISSMIFAIASAASLHLPGHIC